MPGFIELVTAISIWCAGATDDHKHAACQKIMLKCVQESGQNYDSALETCIMDAHEFEWRFTNREIQMFYRPNDV